jgi:hypothetical protein
VTQLLGPDGQPISSKQFQNKKAPAPPLGERYGQWAGEEIRLMQLPGGGAIAFDLNMLTLADYRQMKDHYQINSSLSILTFMMHQMEWHIECEDKKQATFIEESLQAVWSRLVRAMSQALWAGYGPNVLQWENDTDGRRIVLDKIKDLIPEDCMVKWDEVRAPGSQTEVGPKFKVFGGIQQLGAMRHIPVSNSFWYPLLMENGNYYGRQLLRSAFQPWFFSTLLHLFANRYYERFGEPVPVGRAPYEEEIDVNGENVRGNVLMGTILNQLRNRSAVVLPNEKTKFGDETTLDYDYSIQYLESQMRGADFERYMTRLDEEMSLAMFTPILMMRTADVGSYNLGTQHTQVYQWMLNAFSGDWAHYIDRYIVRPLNVLNSPRGLNAPHARIKFTKMGKVKAELLQAVVTELMTKDKIKPNIRELGEMSGLTFEEIRVVTSPDDPDEPKPNEDDDEDTSGGQASDTARNIMGRIEGQVAKAFREGTFGATFTPRMGYRRQFLEALRTDGHTNAETLTEKFYMRMQGWLDSVIALGQDEFRDAEQFMRLFKTTLDNEIERIGR